MFLVFCLTKSLLEWSGVNCKNILSEKLSSACCVSQGEYVGGSLPYHSALRESSISSGKIGCTIIFM